MTESFRFSPNPNRAHEIQWRHWGAGAFAEAAGAERPILLHLGTTWCRACQEMDEDAFSDGGVIALLNRELIPVRVDGDRLPHVQDRYIAGGWPTTAILAPSGEVFWSDTQVSAAELRRMAKGVLEAWSDRREAVLADIEQRRKAMDTARSRRTAQRMVRREAADDVLTGAQEQFDPRNGGFGQEPKFIHAEGVELLFEQGRSLPNPDWVAMAERTLDGMLAGQIQDPVEGGFFHYALRADWTEPQVEKLLSVNARALSAYALGAHLFPGREDWRAAAERTVTWVDRTLEQGELWTGSQAADPEYFRADEEARSDRGTPPVDDTVYADSAGQWIASLARSGSLLESDPWVERSSRALQALLDRMATADDSVVHYGSSDGTGPSGLLVDLLHSARAALAVAEATGSDEPLQHARRLAGVMKDTLWDERGGFVDYPRTVEPLGALRYRARPFEENALAARLYLGLARHTGDASYRAVAERTLGFLSPQAGRYAVEGATFARAVEEFFALRR